MWIGREGGANVSVQGRGWVGFIPVLNSVRVGDGMIPLVVWLDALATGRSVRCLGHSTTTRRTCSK